MSEKVEQVARALAKVHFSRKYHPGDPADAQVRIMSLVNDYWRNHIDDARAAIEAMAQPTEAMMAERSQTEINGYRAMIDEALK